MEPGNKEVEAKVSESPEERLERAVYRLTGLSMADYESLPARLRKALEAEAGVRL